MGFCGFGTNSANNIKRPSDVRETQLKMKVLVLNIIGGMIVAILSVLYLKFNRVMRKWWFKRIFGQDADKDGMYYVVYGKLSLRECLDANGDRIQFPYAKQPRAGILSPVGFSIQNPVSSSELRAAKYIASAFAYSAASQPILTSDIDIDLSESPLDRSFISLGNLSNWKTLDAFENPSNKLVRMTASNFISTLHERQVLDKNKRFDYGLILRIRPEQFPHRVWIVCAGLGEWGTSGATWYLSNKWKKLLWSNWFWWNPIGFGKGTDFATIVRIKPGQDESAIPVAHFKTQKDVESAADNIDSLREVQPSTE